MEIDEKILKTCLENLERSLNSLKGYISSEFYDKLCNLIFNKKHGYHIIYPYLFLLDEYRKQFECEINHFTLCSNLYHIHLSLFDALIDKSFNEEDDYYNLILISHSLNELSIKELHTVFTPKSIFWNYFNTRKLEFYNAVLLEKEILKKKTECFETSDFEIIAKGKTAFAKAASDGICVLTGRDNDITVLSVSQDYFYIALQLIDDLKDWKNDYHNEQYTYLLLKTFDIHKIKIYQDHKPDIELLGKMIYGTGIAERILLMAEEYFNKAYDILDRLEYQRWKQVIQYELSNCENLRLNITDYLEKAKN